MTATKKQTTPTNVNPAELGPNRKQPPETENKAEPKLEKPSTETTVDSQTIETYLVGFPGSEKMMANTATGDQVAVHRFEYGDGLELKRGVVQKNEQHAIEDHDDEPLDIRAGFAKQAVDQSATEAKDTSELIKILAENKNSLLVVDPDTVKGPMQGEGGLDLLIQKNDFDKMEAQLADLGYSSEKKGEAGVEMSKGGTKLSFLFAKEKTVAPIGKPEASNDKPYEAKQATKKMIGRLPTDKKAEIAAVYQKFSEKEQLSGPLAENKKMMNTVPEEWFAEAYERWQVKPPEPKGVEEPAFVALEELFQEMKKLSGELKEKEA